MKSILRKIALGALLTLAATGAATAADFGDGAPAPAFVPAFDWSGTYFGVQAGLDWNSALTPPFSATESGAIAGLYGGVNWQTDPNWVFGLDGSINWDGARGTATPPAPGTPNSAGPTWKGFVRGRVGYAFDNMLIYASGGGAVMGYRATVTGVGTGSATPWGWTIGAGVEFAMSSGWVGRIDYAYQDFGTFTLAGTAPVGGTAVSVTSNTLTVGIARKY
jgi:outer membrane immunogenic protein